MPEITVIVPVYKVEAYLDRCVTSILNQSFRDFELVLVDDGSPDRCGQMCDRWAETDSRIHVLHQKNGGLSAARNAGLDWMCRESGSRWVTFIDSDDWVHPQLLQWLLQGAREENCGLCVCGYAETTGEDPWSLEPRPQTQCWSAADFYREKFINATIAWGKLYKRELFETLRYPVGKLHEDEFVTYQVLFRQGRFAYVPAPLYAYYVNPNGITKSGWNPRRLDAWEAYEQQIAFFEKEKLQDMVKFRYRCYLENAEVNLNAAREMPDQYPSQIRFMEKRIRSVIRRAWRAGALVYRYDYDLLLRFYPFLTRGYRFWLEKIQ